MIFTVLQHFSNSNKEIINYKKMTNPKETERQKGKGEEREWKREIEREKKEENE